MPKLLIVFYLKEPVNFNLSVIELKIKMRINFRKDPRFIRAKEIIVRKYPIFALLTPSVLIKLIVLSLLFHLVSLIIKSNFPGNFLVSTIASKAGDIAVSGIAVCSSGLFFLISAVFRVYKLGERVGLQRKNTQEKYRALPVLSFHANVQTKLTIKIDLAAHYKLHDVTSLLLSSSTLDLDDAYCYNAGFIDIAKFRIISLKKNRANQFELLLGTCAFRDIWKTHYNATMILSEQSVSDRNESRSLRTAFQASIQRANDIYMNEWQKDICVYQPLPIAPAPLGVTGIVLYQVEEIWWTVLRSRGNHEVQDNGLTEWSFSGLIEVEAFLDKNEIELKDIVLHEMADELVQYLPTKLAEQTMRSSSQFALGLVLNEPLLSQPELIIAVLVYSIEAEIWKSSTRKFGLTQEIRDRRKGIHFTPIKVSDLASHFQLLQEAGKLKSLCQPSLGLLSESNLIGRC